ncbi:MAG: BatA domain-containing protein [Planctomycetes bacterium]|nr:BatA domain-containing protein [Planctomycetota bacterium]
MSFEAFAWLLVPLVPALIALYFLKLKRREMVISSTFLWKRSIEDLHVNSPFQHLRRNLLLLLQLLILIAMILAASRPKITGSAGSGVARLLLIDNSASMNVREKEGTRLELAKKKALEGVSGKEPADVMAVIAFSHRPAVLQSLTSDASRLRRAVESVEPTHYPTDFRSALQTAASMADPQILEGGAEIQVYSDGGFSSLSAIAPELERLSIRFFPIGEETENLGIVELDVRQRFAAANGRREIFAGVANSGSVDRQATLSLYQENVLKDAVKLAAPAGKTVSHVFDGSAYSGAMVRLELEAGGALAEDDRAWIRLDPPRPVELLIVGEANWFLDKVVQVQPSFKGRRVPLSTYEAMLKDGRLAADPAQVLLFDRQAPGAPPDRPAIYLGCHPELKGLLGKSATGGEPAGAAPGQPAAAPARVQNPVIVDWDRGHPANRFLAFADLLIAESWQFPASSAFRSILDGAEGSLGGTVAVAPSGKPAFNALILGFDLFKTNWPWLPSFPIFFSNAIAWLGSSGNGEAASRYRTGEPLLYYPEKESKVQQFTMVDPAGGERAVAAESSGEVSFPGTALAGVYALRGDGKTLVSFAVSLLDAGESRIAPRGEIQLGSARIVPPREIAESRDLWKWFAAAALLVCLLEWWIYNRRVAI